jgi:predicted dehydrogenase
MEAPGSIVVAVSDLQRHRLAEAQARYPSARTTTCYEDLLNNPDIDAIVIATPVSSHFEIGLQALRAGKHVLIEKPMAATSDQALRLIDEADRRGLVLMVDHTFVYTSAVRKIRDLVNSKALGDICYYDSVRVNLGLFQHDVNVLWDLGVHDLSILDYVLWDSPVAVSATGASHVRGKPENIAYLTLFFDSSLIAHLHVNWLSPVKVRRTLLGGTEKMIVYDDLEPSEKVKVYDKGITVSGEAEEKYNLLVSYRSGDMYAPKVDTTEALFTEARHFIDCIRHNKRPETDGQAGLRIVRILEAAEQSLRSRGRLVELELAHQEAAACSNF